MESNQYIAGPIESLVKFNRLREQHTFNPPGFLLLDTQVWTDARLLRRHHIYDIGCVPMVNGMDGVLTDMFESNFGMAGLAGQAKNALYPEQD